MKPLALIFLTAILSGCSVLQMSRTERRWFAEELEKRAYEDARLRTALIDFKPTPSP